MKLVLIQGSLSPHSRTAILLHEAITLLKEKNITHDVLDLRQLSIPFCDGRDLEEYDSTIQQIYKTIEQADAVLFAFPVYNYAMAGPFKNFLDIMIHAVEKKRFGVLCNSGGVRSYLVSNDLVRSLMYEVAAVPVQPFVHSWGNDFEKGELTNNHVKEKVKQLIDAMLKD